MYTFLDTSSTLLETLVNDEIEVDIILHFVKLYLKLQNSAKTEFYNG